MSMNYNLRRMAEACREHVENNFHPLPAAYREEFLPIRDRIIAVMAESQAQMGESNVQAIADLRVKCDRIKDSLSDQTHKIHGHIRNGEAEKLTVTYVYLNLLQESQEMISSLRKLLRASMKLQDGSVAVRGYVDTATATV